jgi:hypothetical protein
MPSTYKIVITMPEGATPRGAMEIATEILSDYDGEFETSSFVFDKDARALQINLIMDEKPTFKAVQRLAKEIVVEWHEDIVTAEVVETISI